MLPARARLIPRPDLLDPITADHRMTPEQLLATIPGAMSEEVLEFDIDIVDYDEVIGDMFRVPAGVSLGASADLTLIMPDFFAPVD